MDKLIEASQQPEPKNSKNCKSATFIIPGNPIPLARHRNWNGRIWDEQKQLKHSISLILGNQHNGIQFTGPLKIDITFYMPMPKSSAKRHNFLRGTYHFIKPDSDNMIKWICDVSNKLLYNDDCQVAYIIAKKIYADEGKTEFTITELKNDKVL